MFSYNLTDKQKELLRLAVLAVREENQENSFLVSIDMQGADVIGIKQRFGHEIEDNLIALADADLVTVRHLSQGSLRFSVKRSGFNLVDDNFEGSQFPSGANLSVGAIIYGGVRGGNIQAIGFADHTELQQVINDPKLLNDRIEECLENLVEAVKDDLSRKSLAEYLDAADQMKDHLTSNEPDPSTFQRVFQTLAFFGDVEGTISLTARVWPYIYPLIVIASEILKK